jgi:hypothetical protein
VARGVHTPRANKTSDLLIGVEDIRRSTWWAGDRENIVGRMDRNAKNEAMNFIEDRMESSRQQTKLMRTKMANQDKQYKSEWQSDKADKDEDIFLPKTREEVNAVRAFIISILAQLRPVVRMAPVATSTIKSQNDEDYKRAKLNEAMFSYYWHDIWHSIDDVMPRFLAHFLKYPMGVFKVVYQEEDYAPDLRLEVVDRAFLYIDPRANLFHEAGWIMEEYYLPKSEALLRVERGDWIMTDQEVEEIQSVESGAFRGGDLQRFFGRYDTTINPINEDEFVQCFDYWQFPRAGLIDVFATIIGGTDSTVGTPNGQLVRYGRNPFPYKGNPYVAASYNPDDRPDGQGLVELQEPFQRIINTFYNLRVADVRKNIRQQKFILPQMFDTQSEADMKNGNTIVKLSETWAESVMADPNADIRKYIGELNTGTSTSELLTQDLPWIMNQGQMSSNLPDVFRGLNAQPGATLGQIQEQISRSSGQFTPVIRQVMRAIERIAEITTSYFRDADFYPEERIVRVVGKNSYVDTIDDWNIVNDNTAFKSVTADDMDVDLIFDAISGADAINAQTLLMTSIERIMQSIGQIPQLFDILNREVDFVALFKQLINVNGYDIEGILLTQNEKDKRAQQEEIKKQQILQEQRRQQMEALQVQEAIKGMETKFKILEEQAKQQAIAQKTIGVDTAKTMQGIESQTLIQEQKSDLDLRNTIQEIVRQFMVDANLMRLQTEEDKDKMDHEASLERQAIEAGDSISVGRDSDNIELNDGQSQ